MIVDLRLSTNITLPLIPFDLKDFCSLKCLHTISIENMLATPAYTAKQIIVIEFSFFDTMALFSFKHWNSSTSISKPRT